MRCQSRGLAEAARTWTSTWLSPGSTGMCATPMYLAVTATILGQALLLWRPVLLACPKDYASA